MSHDMYYSQGGGGGTSSSDDTTGGGVGQSQIQSDQDHYHQHHPHPSHPVYGCDTPLAAQAQLHSNDEESAHLDTVCTSFRQYATFARYGRVGHANRIRSLPQSQRQYLPPALLHGTTQEAQSREAMYQDAEIQNQFFFDSMLRHAGVPTSQDVIKETKKKKKQSEKGEKRTTTTNTTTTVWSTDENMSKVTSVLKSLARDWSTEGMAEREMCYKPIMDGLRRHLPVRDDYSRPPPPRLVVPGAGVGRLATELSSMGYEVQGNEFSLHMLLASDFILNGGCSPERQFAISPWLMETRNVCRATDPTRKVRIPDVNPVDMLTNRTSSSNSGFGNDATTTERPPSPEFSMAAGEFVSIYSNPNEHNKWSGVVSCFFLDTAPCIIQYLTVIYNMLMDDGILINFGPLLYHWSGPPTRPDDNNSEQEYNKKHSHLDRRYLDSVDMCWEDVREILIRVGFVLEEETLGLKAHYTNDTKSFMTSEYRCVYFVARKKKRG